MDRGPFIKLSRRQGKIHNLPYLGQEREKEMKGKREKPKEPSTFVGGF